jgi:hypothetical protein
VANKVKNANASAKYGANAGYEAEDWQMADALPGSMGAGGINCAVVGAETVVLYLQTRVVFRLQTRQPVWSEGVIL